MGNIGNLWGWMQAVWPLVAHTGAAGGLIAGLLAAAYFSPVFKKEFVYAAIIIAVGLFVYGIGVHDEKVKRDKQEQLFSQGVHKAVERAKTSKDKDPFDDPRN